jgi:hypothetical protein
MSATQIWQRLFVGGTGDAESNLIEITTVVTLCRETVQKSAPGVNCLYFPLRDARMESSTPPRRKSEGCERLNPIPYC